MPIAGISGELFTNADGKPKQDGERQAAISWEIFI
jgi:hypothetical protein